MTRRLLRGLWAASLPCGCVAGIYETYGGETLAILDARREGCAEADHTVGSLLAGVDTDPAALVRARTRRPDDGS